MESGAVDRSRRFFAIEEMEQRVLCLKMTTGCWLLRALIVSSCDSSVRSIQFIEYKNRTEKLDMM